MVLEVSAFDLKIDVRDQLGLRMSVMMVLIKVVN